MVEQAPVGTAVLCIPLPVPGEECCSGEGRRAASRSLCNQGSRGEPPGRYKCTDAALTWCLDAVGPLVSKRNCGARQGSRGASGSRAWTGGSSTAAEYEAESAPELAQQQASVQDPKLPSNVNSIPSTIPSRAAILQDWNTSPDDENRISGQGNGTTLHSRRLSCRHPGRSCEPTPLQLWEKGCKYNCRGTVPKTVSIDTSLYPSVSL